MVHFHSLAPILLGPHSLQSTCSSPGILALGDGMGRQYISWQLGHCPQKAYILFRKIKLSQASTVRSNREEHGISHKLRPLKSIDGPCAGHTASKF